MAGCLLTFACSDDPVEPGDPPVKLAWTPIASGTPQTLWSVVGAESDNMFAFGDNSTIRRFNGEGWTIEIGIGSCEFRDSWQAPSGNIYAVGSTTSGCVRIYDGDKWADLGGYPGGYRYTAIWGFSDDDIFLTGTPTLGSFGARAIRWDGNDWTVKQVNATTGLNALWGTSSIDMFAVGGAALIYHFDGTDWTEMQTGALKALFGVWGFSSKDVYACGDGGTILHYDGKDWVAQTSGIDTSLLAVWGPSPDDIFAVGFEGVVLHFDGSEWTEMDSGTDTDLFDVKGSSRTNVFAVGSSGGIIRYSPQ